MNSPSFLPRSLGFWHRVALLLLAISLTLSSPPAIALSIDAVPNPRLTYGGWIVDKGELLPTRTERKLDNWIDAVEAETGIEIAVVTVPSVVPYFSTVAYATDLFNRWGIGKGDRNNGLLILLAKDERRVEIKTGSGLLEVLPDDTVQAIIDNDILPAFRDGQFGRGTLAGLAAILNCIAPDNAPTAPGLRPTYHLPTLPSLPNNLLAPEAVVAIFLGAIAIGLVRVLSPIVADPGGRSAREGERRDRRILCSQCHLPLDRLPVAEAHTHLSPAQKVAMEIGGSYFEVWRCPSTCKQEPKSTSLHLREYLLGKRGSFRQCPSCQERTVRQTITVLTEATATVKGKGIRHLTCAACDYNTETEYEIPRKSRGHYDSDDTYYGDGADSSNSGGGFGGGDAGGGAGGSW